MDYQILIFSTAIGISLLANCICCYANCNKQKHLNKLKQRDKLQELTTLAKNCSENASSSTLPKWVVNEYLEHKSSLQV